MQVLAEKTKKKVKIRLLHAKEPGENFRKDFDRFPVFLQSGYFERYLCPRVHAKIIIIDRHTAYVGSANLTGAGLGAKNENKRNFELGVLIKEKNHLKKIEKYFEQIVSGKFCATCQRRDFCPDPLDL